MALKDFSCLWTNRVAVWNESVIHTCKYGFIDAKNFTRIDNTITTTRTNATQSDAHLLFHLQQKSQDCNLTFYGTTSGIYVTNQLVKGNLSRKI